MPAKHVLFWIVMLLLCSFPLMGQEATVAESNEFPFRTEAISDSTGRVFFETYPDAITGRLYVSRKYTALQLAGPLQQAGPRLEPFSTLNLGVGASYKGLTLNLATGFGFMNPENGRGETRFLDLQAHAYPKKWVFDFFGQFYTGFHDPAIRLPEGDLLQLPDSRIRKFGLNVQRLLRPERISLRAAFLQTERQVRSGGSPLIGVEGFGGRISRLPLGFSTHEGADLLALNFFSLGPNAAYAHTFVWRRFFLTGMFSAALPLSYSQQSFHAPKTEQEHVFGIGMQFFLRGFVGYDAGRWSINANYVHNRVELLAGELMPMTLMTGNYRINFIYRFGVSERVYPVAELFNLRRYL